MCELHCTATPETHAPIRTVSARARRIEHQWLRPDVARLAGTVYDLAATVSHHGCERDDGHYTADVRQVRSTERRS